jgi:hypothetical protein
MKKHLLVSLSIFAFTISAKAQSGFEAILLADKADSQKLMEAYFAPGIEGFINAMNSGWYHTAKVHKTLGFDVTIGASGAFIPSERELFNLTALNLASVSSSSATASTFAGPNNVTVMNVERTVNGRTFSTDFNFPGGAMEDLPGNAVPAPIIQLNVGLPWDIEVMGRFVPEINFGDNDGSINMYGLGLKKEITDWFGPIGKTPLHISLLAAYSSMEVQYGIGDITTSNLEVRNGLTSFNLTSFTAQAIASLNLPFINFYGGIGYNTGSSNFRMKGTYTGIYSSTTAPIISVRETLDIPSNLDFNSSGMAATVGTRLSLGFFKIFGSYTLQEYNTVNAGIAVSIR